MDFYVQRESRELREEVSAESIRIYSILEYICIYGAAALLCTKERKEFRRRRREESEAIQHDWRYDPKGFRGSLLFSICFFFSFHVALISVTIIALDLFNLYLYQKGIHPDRRGGERWEVRRIVHRTLQTTSGFFSRRKEKKEKQNENKKVLRQNDCQSAQKCK
jgi:hypothetical protein